MDFLIKGLPENENHEKKSSAKKNSSTDNEMEEMLKAMGLNIFPDPSSMQNNNCNNPLSDLSGLMNTIMGMLDPNCNLNSATSNPGTPNIKLINSIGAQNINFENGESDAFINTPLASIVVEESEDIQSDFKMLYKITGDDNIDVSILSGFKFHGDFTEEDFMNMFNHFGIVGYGEKYMLCNAVSENADELGIFFAIVKTFNGYEVVVPKYGNTYFMTGPDPSLYNCEEHSAMYENGTFKYTNLSKVRLGLDWMLYVDKGHRYSPVDFGTIKPVLSGAEISERDAQYVYVGHLISNDDDEATLFKKDMGCENKKVFDLYIRFDSRECQPSVIAKVLKNVDLNTCNIFKNGELKARGSALYIDMDLGVIPKYLYKILMNRVDSDEYLY